MYLRTIGKNNRLKVLDLGCATGSMLGRIENFGSVIGTDMSYYALSWINNKEIDLVQSDASSLPFKDDSFDVVVLFDLLYHKDIASESAVLSQVRRVLKKNGSVIITDSAFMSLCGAHDKAAQGIRRFSRKRIKDLLNENGFKVEHFTYNYMILFPIVWLKRKILPRFIGSKMNIKLEFRKTNIFVNGILTGFFNLEFMLSRFLQLPIGVTFSCWGRR